MRLTFPLFKENSAFHSVLQIVVYNHTLQIFIIKMEWNCSILLVINYLNVEYSTVLPKWNSGCTFTPSLSKKKENVNTIADIHLVFFVGK